MTTQPQPTPNLASPALPTTRIADPADLPFVTDPGERRGDMLYRRFGRTDELLSAIGMAVSTSAKTR